MGKELDAGDILALQKIEIDRNETARELRPRLIQIGAELLTDVVPAYLEGALALIPQNAAEATYTKKISKEEREIDLSADARTNWNTYRAYAEPPGTYFFLKRGDTNIRVKIVTAKFEHEVFTPLRVVPEGKKEMDYMNLG
jgi:methionyl-tRNA formyltransferase